MNSDKLEKEKKSIQTNYLNIDAVINRNFITSEHLRIAADAMDSDGVEHIKLTFGVGYYSDVIGVEYSCRLETDAEYQERLKSIQENDSKN